MNSLNECKEIFDLDLDPIKVKLMHVESGEGWSRQTVDALESEYRRFLYLMKFFPNEQVAPLAEVDIFWHYHILDTMKYAADCEDIFGYFLHHFPYVGLSETDGEAHQAAGNRMSELYEDVFGEPLVRDGAINAATSADASGPLNDAAYSIRVPQSAVSTSAAKTAYSIRVPENAVSSKAAKTAYSIRVPESAVSSTAAKTAYSIRVPQQAVASSAGTTAYSIRVPQNSAGASFFKMERPTLAAA